MRKTFLLGGISLFLLLAAPVAQAVPTLQLYSDGAVYDKTTSSWMTYNDPFTLQVLGADQPNSLNYVDQVKLHIAVPSQYFTSYGQVVIQGVTSSLEHGPAGPLIFTASDFMKGIPPDLAGNSGNSRTHDIYKDAYYVSVPLENLDVNKHSDVIINYVDVVNGQTPGTDNGDIDRYTITYSGFYLIHMDLTGMAHYTNPSKDTLVFAPFSHDADGVPVPEPGTVVLLGGGLLVLAVCGRKKLRKRES